MLATFSSETIPKTFLKNVTTDLFSDENITEFFKKVENFLKDTVVGQAIQECVKENACVHPFPQLSTYKTNEDNRKTLEAARKKYAGRYLFIQIINRTPTITDLKRKFLRKFLKKMTFLEILQIISDIS